MKITNKQAQVLQAIVQFIGEKKYPPSVRQVSQLLGWRSSATAHQCMVLLKEKGFIDWEPSQPRTLKVIKHAAGL